jgi:Methyltransferase domain
VPVDQQYYREVASGSTAEKLLIAARDRIFQDFIARMQPSASDEILDVGVSDVINDGANVLERSYPHQHKITACGLGEGIGFKAAFPLCRYVQIEPNTRLPFDDNAFDVATSNAVLEHAGSHENQVLLVEELGRVARRVFITVPNRFFPVEHHTAIPLAHYLDGTFRIACMIAGKSEWTDEQNLILMTRKRLLGLAALVAESASAKSSNPMSAAVGYTGLSLGPLSSNLYLAFR